MSSGSQMAATYVPQTQYGRWKNHADELDMSVSEFIKSMVEAGSKKFEATVEPDEAARELREQRNYYKAELDRAQSRVSKLEDRLDQGEQAEIRRFVEENPGVPFDEIHQHLIETVPERANEIIESLEGEEVQVRDGGFYPIEDKLDGGSDWPERPRTLRGGRGSTSTSTTCPTDTGSTTTPGPTTGATFGRSS